MLTLIFGLTEFYFKEMLASLQYPEEKHGETKYKVVLLQLQENYLKRIIYCMVITFVFTVKA